MSPAPAKAPPLESMWTRERPPYVCSVIRRAAAEHLTAPLTILRKSRRKNVAAARKQIVHELAALRVSTTVIGRWLNIHHTSVIYILRGRGPKKFEPFDPSVPDESGVWAI